MSNDHSDKHAAIRELEKSISAQITELHQLQRELPGISVANYTFDTLDGQVSLRDLFGDSEQLLMVHNMGQGCRYCTLWADGINGFVPHLESAMPLVIASKDPPRLQQQLARSRHWQFRMVSHHGGRYQQEQVAGEGMDNAPGVVLYQRKGEDIERRSSSYFGPGDLYCSLWHFLALAGLDYKTWTPQYNYWLRPDQLEDGGEDVLG